MDFNLDTGTIYNGIQTIDPTVLPPLGGVAGVLTIAGTGALLLPSGTTAEEPLTPIAGMVRFNTENSAIEVYNGTAWGASAGSGSVTSVDAAVTGTGLTVTGGPITTAGTLTFELSAVLQGLDSLPPSAGLIVQTTPGTFVSRTITGTAGNIAVANGDGATGDPTINLVVAGTPVTDAFVKITTDTFGRVTATSAVSDIDLTGILDDVYVNITGDTMTGSLILTGATSQVTLPNAPVTGTDATNKAYVDAVAQGFNFKEAVIAATTAADGNIDLAIGGLIPIDAVDPLEGSRVLVKNQTDETENGIYDASAGPWVRSAASDTGDELVGAFVFVEGGSLNANTSWAQITAGPITIGTTPIVWSQFSAAGSYTAGAGLVLTGTEFSLDSPVLTSLGGTGTETPPLAGQVLIGTATDTYVPADLDAGIGIDIAGSAGAITISNTGVISVAGTTNQIDAVTTAGVVTLSLPAVLEIPGTINLPPTGDNGIIVVDDIGDVSSLVLEDGQLVIGATGLPAVAATLTAGTGVTIINGPGAITISAAGAGGTVTSVDVSGGTTGLTTSGGPVTGVGVITLDGTLNVANGGTGLAALGPADTVLGVNSLGTASEYKALTAGTGISVVHGANVVTFNNTGVTSVGLADTSTTPIYTITGSPVTTTGTLSTTLTNQVANTVFAGPVTGVAAQPTFRALTVADFSGALQLYRESPLSPVTPVATGDNAIALGSGAVASGDGSFAEGEGASATLPGQKAYANGSFVAAGDAQHSVYVLRNQTTDATATQLFLNGTSAQIVLVDNSVYTFDIIVSGRRTDAVGGGAGYRFLGVAKKDTTPASTTFIGTPSKTIIGETDTAWDASVSIDAATGAFVVNVIGEAAKTIHWVATVQTTEVSN